MEEKVEMIADLFKLLSNRYRLLILCALMERSTGVSELADMFPQITRAALSQHLHSLKAADLISGEKCGQYVTYSLTDDRIKKLFEVVKKQYCD